MPFVFLHQGVMISLSSVFGFIELFHTVFLSNSSTVSSTVKRIFRSTAIIQPSESLSKAGFPLYSNRSTFSVTSKANFPLYSNHPKNL
jgi:hypothetical protein